MIPSAEINLIALQQRIVQRERQRCEALVRNDIAALERLLSPDLLHIHANGQAQDRAAYLNTIAQHLEFITVCRSDLHVRLLGACAEVALATGTLQQTVRMRATGQQTDMRIITTQVWQLCAGEGVWRQSSFHATHLA